MEHCGGVQPDRWMGRLRTSDLNADYTVIATLSSAAPISRCNAQTRYPCCIASITESPASSLRSHLTAVYECIRARSVGLSSSTTCFVFRLTDEYVILRHGINSSVRNMFYSEAKANQISWLSE